MATSEQTHGEPSSTPNGRSRWSCLLAFVAVLVVLYFLQKIGCSPLQTHEDVQMIE